jgi:hypothetical protein
MTLADDCCYLRVMLVRAFPLSDPDHYIGVLDGDGKDIGVLVDPAELGEYERKTVAEELEKRYFVPVVTRVIEAKEDFGTVVWDVETNRGRKRYLVRGMKDNIVELGAGRMIVTDVDGNRFEIPDVQKLDMSVLGLVLRSI